MYMYVCIAMFCLIEIYIYLYLLHQLKICMCYNAFITGSVFALITLIYLTQSIFILIPMLFLLKMCVFISMPYLTGEFSW